jgi:magnesium transporter
MLSDAEERELERAQHRREHDASDDEEHRQYRHDEHHSDAESSHTYNSRRRRRRSDSERRDSDGLRRVGSYATADGIRSVFDFAAMDEFAAEEREALDETEGPATGVTAEEMGAPPSGIDAEMRRRSEAVVRVASPARQQSGEVSGSGSSTRQGEDNSNGFEDDLMSLPKEEDELPQPRFGRRARKQSKQANPARRQAKLALFESFGAGEGEELQGGALKAPRPGARPHAPPPPSADPAPPKFTPYTDSPGHDRPYRFSFYSNALPVTIHARSLAELPAEGQTFEDLFKGRNYPGEEPRTSTEIPRSSGRNTPKELSGLSLSAPKPQSWSQAAITKSMVMPGAAPTPPPPNPDDDPEAYTWWLDVLSPTDDEMRMLSRVFGIHPLTTEDILLEETREKIELFRNYYLVCFRSFDQDPYSQTYLEPLNMYIIVFREGTLSVSCSASLSSCDLCLSS